MPTITGTTGDDVLLGTSGDDVINGLAGRDTITGGLGADWLIGLDVESILHRDTFVYLSVADSPRAGGIDVVSLGATDVIDFSALNPTAVIMSHIGVTLTSGVPQGGIHYYLTAVTAAGDLQVRLFTNGEGSAPPTTYTGSVTVVGSEFRNFIIGGQSADALYGNGGDDYMIGSTYIASLNGNAVGVGDVFYGGAGRDTFAFSAFFTPPGTIPDLIADFEQGQDSIQFGSGTGIFSILRLDTGGSYAYYSAQEGTIAVAVPRVALNGADISSSFFQVLNIFGSTLNETLVGTDFARNLMKGEAGNDTLIGGDSNDTLVGGRGFDALFGRNGNDVFVYSNRLDSTLTEADIIFDFVSGREKIDLTAIRTGANDRFGIAYLGTGSFLFVDLGGEGTYDMLIQLANTHLLASDITWGTANGALEEAASLTPLRFCP